MDMTHLEGAAAEFVAAAFFLRRGYDVLWPSSGAARYDFALEMNGEVTKVQVKKVSVSSTAKKRVKCTPDGGRKRRVYASGDFDVLVAVDGNDLWIIPYKDIADRGMLPLATDDKWAQKG